VCGSLKISKSPINVVKLMPKQINYLGVLSRTVEFKSVSIMLRLTV